MANLPRGPLIFRGWLARISASLELNLGTPKNLIATPSGSSLALRAQHDWPNPAGSTLGRGVADSVQSHIDHYSIIDVPALQLWDSPNPILRVSSRSLDWISSSPFMLLAASPPPTYMIRLFDLPNPILRVVQRPDWLGSSPSYLLTSISGIPMRGLCLPNFGYRSAMIGT